MELVYLWVQKYKNIENQGFNFNPKYECDYKDGKLSINKKEFTSIFPKNINVVSLVGENGSGKSSLIKLILFLIYLKKYESLTLNHEEIEKHESSIIQTLSNIYLNKNIFLIIEHKNKILKMSLLEVLKNCYRKTFPLSKVNDIEKMEDCTLTVPELEGTELDFFSIHFNYMLDTLYDGFHDEWVKSVYHRNDSYSTPILLEPYKNTDNEEKIDLKIVEYLNNQRMLKFYSKIISNKTVTTFFNPNKVKLTYSEVQGYKILNEKKNKGKGFDYTDFFGDVYKLEDKFRKLLIKYSIKISNGWVFNICEQIRKLYRNNRLEKLNKLYIAFKALSSNEKLFDDKIYQKIYTNFHRRTATYSGKDYIDLLIDFDIIKLLKSQNTYETYKIEKCISFNDRLEESNHQVLIKSLNKIRNIEDINELLNSIPPWLEVEFFEDMKSIKALSSGQKGLFSFLINIVYQLDNIKYKPYETINLFLDETDVGFHPEWQRLYLKEVLNSIKNNWKKKINIVFLTHSPFLISDLPKQNVMFLDNGEQVFPDIEPFGANIHTLLSHGFFMKNGLMGEYAKEKIDEIINYLNRKSLNEKEISYCENIISFIGEPILKRRLQQILDSKRLKKMDDISKKISDMEYELNILKNHQQRHIQNKIKNKAKKKYNKDKKND